MNRFVQETLIQIQWHGTIELTEVELTRTVLFCTLNLQGFVLISTHTHMFCRRNLIKNYKIP